MIAIDGAVPAMAGSARGNLRAPNAQQKRLAPADFAVRAAAMSKNQLALHYCTAFRVIQRWLDEAGMVPFVPRGRPVPEDFAARAAVTTRKGLCEVYRAGADTISRWIVESGARPKPGARPNFGNKPIRVAIDMSIAGRAVEFLRPRFVISRADLHPPERTKGLPDKGKGFWFVGNMGPKSAAEVIALAEAKGFDPRAWARI